MAVPSKLHLSLESSPCPLRPSLLGRCYRTEGCDRALRAPPSSSWLATSTQEHRNGAGYAAAIKCWAARSQRLPAVCKARPALRSATTTGLRRSASLCAERLRSLSCSPSARASVDDQAEQRYAAGGEAEPHDREAFRLVAVAVLNRHVRRRLSTACAGRASHAESLQHTHDTWHTTYDGDARRSNERTGDRRARKHRVSVCDPLVVCVELRRRLERPLFAREGPERAARTSAHRIRKRVNSLITHAIRHLQATARHTARRDPASAHFECDGAVHARYRVSLGI